MSHPHSLRSLLTLIAVATRLTLRSCGVQSKQRDPVLVPLRTTFLVLASLLMGMRIANRLIGWGAMEWWWDDFTIIPAYLFALCFYSSSVLRKFTTAMLTTEADPFSIQLRHRHRHVGPFLLRPHKLLPRESIHTPFQYSSHVFRRSTTARSSTKSRWPSPKSPSASSSSASSLREVSASTPGATSCSTSSSASPSCSPICSSADLSTLRGKVGPARRKQRALICPMRCMQMDL